MTSESDILAALDRSVHDRKAATVIGSVAEAVKRTLHEDRSARLAWQPIPLAAYQSLPGEITSSWIFVLRAHCSSGAERHPNSIQRMMSLEGTGDMRLWENGSWQPHVMPSAEGTPLLQRWIAIPKDVWHRPVMGPEDWVVVSFHTASDAELIEERAADDENPESGKPTRELYARRASRA